MKKRSAIRKPLIDRTFLWINRLLLLLFFLIVLYPLLFVLSTSVSDPDAVATGKMVLWPVGFTLEGYQYILRYQDVWVGYANTIFYTFFGTLLNLAVTLPCAYALSRRDLRGTGFIMTLFLITMYFGGGLIPSYLLMQKLGLVNTRAYLLVGSLVNTYNLIVARTFFANTIPWELHEASFIDGCSDFQVFRHVVIPLSKPIVVVMMLYYGVAHWNSYFNAMVYLNDASKYPLQVFLREILLQSQWAQNAMADGGSYTAEELAMLTKQASTANMLKYCLIVVSAAPMLILYPFLQRFFAKGVMIGAVKG